MATSKFITNLETATGEKITTGIVQLLPYGNSYPTGAVSLTHANDGIWYAAAVVDGEYSLYYNGTVVLNYQRFWVGENRLSAIALNFDSTDGYKIFTTGIKDAAIKKNHLYEDVFGDGITQDIDGKIKIDKIPPSSFRSTALKLLSGTAIVAGDFTVAPASYTPVIQFNAGAGGYFEALTAVPEGKRAAFYLDSDADKAVWLLSMSSGYVVVGYGADTDHYTMVAVYGENRGTIYDCDADDRTSAVSRGIATITTPETSAYDVISVEYSDGVFYLKIKRYNAGTDSWGELEDYFRINTKDFPTVTNWTNVKYGFSVDAGGAYICFVSKGVATLKNVNLGTKILSADIDEIADFLITDKIPIITDNEANISGLGYTTLAQLFSRTSGYSVGIIGDSTSLEAPDANKWWKYLETAFNWTIYNCSVAGTKIISDFGCGFVDRCQFDNIGSGINLSQETLDMIIIWGGTNDIPGSPLGPANTYDITTFNGALNQLFATLRADHPTADIFFMTPFQRHNRVGQSPDWQVAAGGRSFEDYVDCIKDRAKIHSVKVIDLWGEGGVTENNWATYYTYAEGDGIHPGTLGQEVAAAIAANNINQTKFIGITT
jgi:hypothetical protein